MVSGLDGVAREAVGRIARPIHGEPDLDRLLEQIAAARIVLIGEASHGAHELDDLRGTPAGDGWFHAMQSAHVLQNAEAYYRTLLRGRVAWNARDARMADAVDMLADQLGQPGRPAKLVVWAHNRHVGDARATAMGEAGEISLGQVMRQRHPGEIALIGMIAYGGTVTCARGWDEPAEVATVPPGLDGSWEQLLHGSGYARFYLGTAALRRAVGEGAERLQRAIGVVYRPETERLRHYHLSRLADEFDVVIHVDAIRAASGVDVVEEPQEPAGAVG